MKFSVLVLGGLVVLTQVFLSCSSPSGGGGTGGGGTSGYLTIDGSTDKSPAADPSYFNVPSSQLGLVFSSGGTQVTFNYWNPDASSVSVVLYTNGSDSLSFPAATLAMNKGSGSVWTTGAVAIPVQAYYDFKVNGSTVVLDPYAKSMAQWNGSSGTDSVGKGAIIDPSTLTPEPEGSGSWSNYGTSSAPYFDGSGLQYKPAGYTYNSAKDAIIYEASIRDLTNDHEWGSSPLAFSTGHQWGTYEALIDMLPHIQKLGVTHIQLQCPLENYYYNQSLITSYESSLSEVGGANYNWGYDPQNYFTPSGMYSSAPGNPAKRITELMTLVNAIHQAGMGVIIDVVFNHTANNNILDGGTIPGYYYRTTSDNGAGSNDVRSEAKMTRKLIVDALLNLVKVYKVDGFRFDLMGVIDTGTINTAYAAVKSINNNAIFVGEGWTGYYSGLPTDYLGNSVAGSDQNHVTAFNGENIAMFSDSYRNVFKNGYPSDGSPAFLTGVSESVSSLASNIEGVPNNTNDTFNPTSTNNVVSYLTCHDNLCLNDVIAVATPYSRNSAGILQRAKLAFGAMMTSQGVGFVYGGDEILRSKYTTGSGNNTASGGGSTYVNNSYNSSDAINAVAWGNAYSSDPVAGGFTNYSASAAGCQLYQYAQGLVALRLSTNAFRLPDGQSSALTWLSGTSGSTQSYAFKVVAPDLSGTYYVFMNAGTGPVTFSGLPDSLGSATCLVDQSKASATTAIPSPVGVSGYSGKAVTLAAETFSVFKL